MCRGIHRTSVQAVDFKRPVGMEILHYSYIFSSGPFWTHKTKTKAKYKSISNTLYLLSAPVSIPHVGAVLASLVVKSRVIVSFLYQRFSFDC